MKRTKNRFLPVFLSLWVVFVPCLFAAPTTPLTLHYLGKAGIQASGEGLTAVELSQRPATKRLLSVALDKLSRAPATLHGIKDDATATSSADALRPILGDLLTAESRLELTGTPGQWAFRLAAMVGPEAAGNWDKHLRALAGQMKLGSVEDLKQEGLTGWQVAPTDHSQGLVFLQGRGWALVATGPAALPALAPWQLALASTGRPIPKAGPAWIDLHADWKAMGELCACFKGLQLPATRFSVTGEKEMLRTSATLDFAKPLPVRQEAWNIPTNLINEPLVSFSTCRGLEQILARSPLIKKLALKELPNQATIWGQSSFRGQTLMTFPLSQPTNAIVQMGPHLPAALQEVFPDLPGTVYWLSNKSEIVWRGLPLMSPFIKPYFSASRPYLIAGVVPVLGPTNPPPPELFAQLKGRDSLLYYGWEITQARLLHHRHYLQLGSIVAGRQGIQTNDASFVFQQEIQDKLGNCISELDLSAPAQLTFTRRSAIGLTGLELVLLGRWIDSPGFPFTFEIPRAPVIRPEDFPKAGKAPPADAPAATP